VIILINKAYRWAVPILTLWLMAWVVLSWDGIQDDALIHLRYADNLFRTHFITYDGVHPNYGVSSLLYVYLLSSFRGLTSSPTLPRLASSCIHLLLYTGLIFLFLRAVPRESHLARLLGLIMLVIFVTPSAVRWLDDGMETGLGLCFVALICWIIFRQSTRSTTTGIQYLAFAALGFFAVLLRTEFILLCGLSFGILVWQRLSDLSNVEKSDRSFNPIASTSHILLGGALALALVRFKMHFLLPDTALAKATGTPWIYTLVATGQVLGGALSFGAGIFFFWLLTIFLLWRARRLSITALFANSVFPILLVLAVIRGQQIQGARYFDWTFCFSILWNILELGRISPLAPDKQPNSRLPYVFLALLFLMLPYESLVMYPMLKSRSTLLQQFESDHFERLEGKRGVANDVGLIGYFSHADICDLAGLVNGREKARQTVSERIAGCAADHPEFMFLNPTTIEGIQPLLSSNDWQVCSRYYDYKNVYSWNRHYLIVPRTTAGKVCKEVSNSVPLDLAHLPQ
jgi:hypothetical protein